MNQQETILEQHLQDNTEQEKENKIQPMEVVSKPLTSSFLNNKILELEAHHEETTKIKIELLELKIREMKLLRNSYFRFLLLFFICMMFLGAIMTQEYPSVLEDDIMKDMFNFDPDKDKDNTALKKEANFKYSLLFIVGNVPNTVLPFVMSFFMEKIGLKKAIFILTLMLAVGNLIQAMSEKIGGGWGTTPTFVIFFIGRFIFYIGDDSLLVAKNTLISKWFIGKELAFALGCTQSFERLGSAFAGWIIPPLYGVSNDLFLPLIVLVIFMTFSWLTSILIGWANDKDEKQQHEFENLRHQIEYMQLKQIENTTVDSQESNGSQVQQERQKPKMVSFKDIKKLPLIYWLIVINLLSNFISFQIFYNYSVHMFHSLYNIKESEVPKITTIPSVMSAFGVPFMGILVDKIGKRQYFIFLAALLCNIGMGIFLFGPDCSDNKHEACDPTIFWIPIIILGIYKIISLGTSFACIPLVVQKKLIPVGFGALLAISNLCLIGGNYGGGQVIAATPTDLKQGFLYELILCLALSSVSLLSAIAIIYYNKIKYNNILGVPKLVEQPKNLVQEGGEEDGNIQQQNESILSIGSSKTLGHDESGLEEKLVE